MLPDPEPSADELMQARVIMMVSADEIEDVISSAFSNQEYANATWELALEAMEKWPKIRDKAGNIRRVGSIEFFENKHIGTRLDLRNYLRELYGLDPLISETSGSLESVSSLQWF